MRSTTPLDEQATALRAAYRMLHRVEAALQADFNEYWDKEISPALSAARTHISQTRVNEAARAAGRSTPAEAFAEALQRPEVLERAVFAILRQVDHQKREQQRTQRLWRQYCALRQLIADICTGIDGEQN